MTKVEAIIRPSQFDAVQEALAQINVDGMTVSEVRGHGRQKGHNEVYRGREYEINLVPKLRLEIVVPDAHVEALVEAILKNAGTGEIGDGKIFLFKVEDAIRIRNREHGDAAL